MDLFSTTAGMQMKKKLYENNSLSLVQDIQYVFKTT